MKKKKQLPRSPPSRVAVYLQLFLCVPNVITYQTKGSRLLLCMGYEGGLIHRICSRYSKGVGEGSRSSSRVGWARALATRQSNRSTLLNVKNIFQCTCILNTQVFILNTIDQAHLLFASKNNFQQLLLTIKSRLPKRS